MRAICTSASLQASTWVSPGFTLFRHSSPPFGSKQAHSNSTYIEAGRCWAFVLCAHHWSLRPPFQYERWYLYKILSLARLFDSLVRVSRRVKAPHCTVSSFEHHGKEGARGDSKLFTLTPPTSPPLLPLVLPELLLCTCCQTWLPRIHAGRNA